MDKRKKLLFVSATLETGGVQHILSNLSVQLAQKYDITILLNDSGRIAYPYGGEVITLNMRNQPDRLSLWYQIKVFFKRYVRLRKLKKRGEYDYCISMLDSANIANILSGSRKCKVVTTVYTNISAKNCIKAYRYIIAPAVKLLYNHSDIIVVTSEGVKNDLQQNYGLYPHKMQVVYDGVDIEEIDTLRNEPVEASEYHIQESTLITTLGRLDTAKGQWHMIRAMKKISKECPNVKLLIMGSGALKEKLIQLVDECGLQDHVEICGYVANPYKYISASKLFVSSSIVEGYPTVILEAMVCGVPCVCTDFESGAREILAPDTKLENRQCETVERAQYGILTPVCDGIFRNGTEPLTKEEELFADGIILLLKDEALRQCYCDKIHEYAKTLSMESCVKDWEKILV